MLRTISLIEKNLRFDPAVVTTVTTAAAIEVLPDVSVNGVEYESRLIQNVGDNPLYYSFGQVVSAAVFHGILYPGGTLPCSCQLVSVLAKDGDTSVSIAILRRIDLTSVGHNIQVQGLA